MRQDTPLPFLGGTPNYPGCFYFVRDAETYRIVAEGVEISKAHGFAKNYGRELLIDLSTNDGWWTYPLSKTYCAECK